MPDHLVDILELDIVVDIIGLCDTILYKVCFYTRKLLLCDFFLYKVCFYTRKLILNDSILYKAYQKGVIIQIHFI